MRNNKYDKLLNFTIPNINNIEKDNNSLSSAESNDSPRQTYLESII
jgi:hypothetical protein